MSTNSGNGGVRNLRAMFENKGGDQSTSPPSRGRSPNPSELSNNSRPVSKVRASFVAVERPGENGSGPILGLRRASEVSSLGGIHEHAVSDGGILEKRSTTRSPSDLGPDASQKKMSNNGTIEGGLGKILKGSAFESNTPSKPPRVVPQPKTTNEVPSSPRDTQKAPKSPVKSKEQLKSPELAKKTKPAEINSKPASAPLTQPQPSKTAQATKSLPVRIATKQDPTSPTIAKSSPKTPTSPAITNIKGGPAKIKGVVESAKQAHQARAEKQVSSQPETAKIAPKIASSSGARSSNIAPSIQKTPISPKAVRSPASSGPKSPLRPTKLPAAATTTTASSVAKDAQLSTAVEHEPRKAIAKKQSTLSVRQPRASTSSVTSTLHKKASRASLANGHDKADRPKSRISTVTSKADEGFLARMMRPTTSSAQKTHDKVQVNSPPRPKTATSHRAKDATAVKRAPPKMPLLAAQATPVETQKDVAEAVNEPEPVEETTSTPAPAEATEKVEEAVPISQPEVEEDTSTGVKEPEPAQSEVDVEPVKVNGNLVEV